MFFYEINPSKGFKWEERESAFMQIWAILGGMNYPFLVKNEKQFRSSTYCQGILFLASQA